MYDRKTNSYWSQFDGRAIVGEYTGKVLNTVSIDTVVWRDWKKEHPDSEVLSQDTGFVRAYGRDPYGSYYEDSFLFFPVEERDDRVHPKTIIFGIEIDGAFKAYRETDLAEQKVITDTIGNVAIRLEQDASGIVTVINLETDEEVVKERGFWFAWYAFHPETELYTGD
jgi:hypothetical protein